MNTDGERGDLPTSRLCVLSEAYYPVVGGAESNTRMLVRELRTIGYPALVLTRRTNRAMSKEELVEGTRVVRVPPAGWIRWGKYAMLIPSLWKLLSMRGEYDLLYVCGFRVLGLIAVPVSLLLRKPCILKAECCGELSGDFMMSDFGDHKPDGVVRNSVLRVMVWLRKVILKRGDLYVSTDEEIGAELRRVDFPLPASCR
jgi:hypothetical protein